MDAQETFLIPGIYSVPGIRNMHYAYESGQFYIQFDVTPHITTEYSHEYLLTMLDDDPQFDFIGDMGKGKIKEFVKRIHISVGLDSTH